MLPYQLIKDNYTNYPSSLSVLLQKKSYNPKKRFFIHNKEDYKDFFPNDNYKNVIIEKCGDDGQKEIITTKRINGNAGFYGQEKFLKKLHNKMKREGMSKNKE